MFLDAVTSDLFGYLTVEDMTSLEALARQPVMKKWWAFMKDLMETNEDDSPVYIPLQEIFYLP